MDYDGDGYETIDDIAVVVYETMVQHSQYQTDLDGDGLVTAEDTIRLIKKIIATSVGDVNVSGGVDAVDVSDSLTAFTSGTNQANADVNMDSVVDSTDVASVIGTAVNTAIRKMCQAELEHVARQVYYSLSNVGPAIEEGSLGSGSGVAAAQGGPDHWPQPPSHNTIQSWCEDAPDDTAPHMTAISRTYPDDHDGQLSRAYPTNHMYSITSEWEYVCGVPGMAPCRHTGSGDWPRNHLQQSSLTWGDCYADHDDNTDCYDMFERWRDHPNHEYEVSSTWPGDHDGAVSNMWPPNHSAANSAANSWPNDEDHNQEISQSWTDDPGEHNGSVSSNWPPNHADGTSDTWAPGHAAQYSVAWPGSHTSQVSGSWPDNVYPGHWPPNHNGAVSGDWDDGVPPPSYDLGLWPPDHAYVPSAQDLTPLF